MRSSSRAEQLAQSIDLAVSAVIGARVDQYRDPTPCTDFTVRDLVNHVARMLLLTTAAGSRTEWDPGLLTADPVPVLAGRPESDWAAVVGRTAGSAAGAWSDTTAWEGEASLVGPPVPAVVLGEILIAEFTVHAWDTAVATGQPLTVPAPLAAVTLDTFTREAPRMRGFGLLADEVPQNAGAPVLDRALALTGRDPRWSRPAV
ncbi:TIGR03086 family metal-binding protein [Streptomyces sp. NPDC087843]|uniref:TIGR03086 family metal-binding protein n=1 Tax=Streptomyces sp. NPDC087843 TaxID=3365804 RepID=UPI003824B237